VRVVWTRTAIRDLVRVRRRIEHDNPIAAREVARRILDAVNKISRHPEMGRVGRLGGTRDLIVTGTPYLVPYRVHADKIHLLRVLHGRQNWPRSSGRRTPRSQRGSG